MTALVAAELLKLRTTRAWLGYLVALVALTGIAVAATVGSASAEELPDPEFQRDLFSSSGFSELIALLLGITSVTWEWRHGTVTPTFLITPVRERVVAAKVVAATLLGAALAVAGALVAFAVAVPWLSAEDASLTADGALWGRLARIVLAAALYGALGAAVGSLVHNQVAALVGAIVWLVLAETLVVGLLGLADLDRAADFLPGRALSALDASAEDGVRLSPWAGLAVGAGYLALLGALGALRTRRRDVT